MPSPSIPADLSEKYAKAVRKAVQLLEENGRLWRVVNNVAECPGRMCTDCRRMALDAQARALGDKVPE